MSKIVLATDLGGTNVRMAAVSEAGDVLFRTRSKTPETRSREEILELIAELARECTNEVGPRDEIVAFGIAAPAVIDHESGVILVAPNLPELNGLAISEYLTRSVGFPVLLENDATAAAIGEHWKGACQGVSSAICLTMGTGVGGGLIIDGKPLRGIDGTAGEVGHICVEPFGVPCTCGSNGCLEQYASATAVVRMAEELIASGRTSSLTELNEYSSHDVFNAGLAGDDVAREVFASVGFYLGVALGGLINLLNPEAIVIGGGASDGWDLFIDSVEVEIAKRAFHHPAQRVKLMRAKLGDDAGILGVAKLAFAD
ncbi:ROK family protein [soil metagenome]